MRSLRTSGSRAAIDGTPVAWDLAPHHYDRPVLYGSIQLEDSRDLPLKKFSIARPKKASSLKHDVDSNMTTRVPKRSMAKMYQLGIRADARRRARWVRKAKMAGLSLNKWAMLVLDNAPEAKSSAIYFGSLKDIR